MTVFRVLTYPHVLLKKKATPVTNFSPDLAEFTKGLISTMEAFEGIGLAAPQVGISKRVTVVDVSPYLENKDVKDWHGSIHVTVDGVVVEKPFPLVLVNPEIVKRDGEVLFPFDGCLSFPGAGGYTSRRARAIEVVARDAENRTQKIVAEGILSICLQHEIDHLDGILFTDRLADSDETQAVIDEMQRYETEPEYRKKLKKLHPVDARTQKFQFL